MNESLAAGRCFPKRTNEPADFTQQVLNYDNEDTRKAASRLVEAVLKQIDSSYACSTRRSKKASKGRLARVLREGQALGAL